MTEARLDGLDVHAVSDEQRALGVPERMGLDALVAVAANERLAGPLDGADVPRVPAEAVVSAEIVEPAVEVVGLDERRPGHPDLLAVLLDVPEREGV